MIENSSWLNNGIFLWYNTTIHIVGLCCWVLCAIGGWVDEWSDEDPEPLPGPKKKQKNNKYLIGGAAFFVWTFGGGIGEYHGAQSWIGGEIELPSI